MVTQIVGNHLVGSNETSQRSKRLAEGTHNKVNLVGQAKVVANATSTLAKDTDTMGLVDHDASVVLASQFHDIGKLAHVTLHRENTVGNDEFHLVGVTLLELSFE